MSSTGNEVTKSYIRVKNESWNVVVNTTDIRMKDNKKEVFREVVIRKNGTEDTIACADDAEGKETLEAMAARMAIMSHAVDSLTALSKIAEVLEPIVTLDSLKLERVKTLVKLAYQIAYVPINRIESDVSRLEKELS